MFLQSIVGLFFSFFLFQIYLFSEQWDEWVAINATEDDNLAAGCKKRESAKRKSCSHILLSFFINIMETLFMEIILHCSFIYLEMLVNIWPFHHVLSCSGCWNSDWGLLKYSIWTSHSFLTVRTHFFHSLQNVILQLYNNNSWGWVSRTLYDIG